MWWVPERKNREALKDDGKALKVATFVALFLSV